MTSVLAILLAAAAVAIVVVDRRSVYAPAVGGFAPRVSWEIARVEGRRLLRHPLVWLGAAAALTSFPYGNNDDGMVQWGLSGIDLVTLAWAGFIVVHLAVSRDRRGNTDELTSALPAGATTRVPGHLLSLLWLLAPVAVLWAGYLAWRLGPELSMQVTGEHFSYWWEPPIAELAQGPAMLAVVLCLAVAAGVWWRHPSAGVIVTVLLFFSPVVWMVPLVVNIGPYVEYMGDTVHHIGIGYLAWHYVFLIGLAGLGVAAALLRRGSRRLWGTASAVAVGVVWAGFLLQRHPWWGM